MPNARQPAAARRTLLGGLLGAGVLLGLGGCGFKLRGVQTLPFQRLRTNLSDQSALGRTLRAQLQASGVQLVADRFREDRLLALGEVIERAAGYDVLRHVPVGR